MAEELKEKDRLREKEQLSNVKRIKELEREKSDLEMDLKSKSQKL